MPASSMPTTSVDISGLADSAFNMVGNVIGTIFPYVIGMTAAYFALRGISFAILCAREGTKGPFIYTDDGEYEYWMQFKDRDGWEDQAPDWVIERSKR
ncbi:MAG: hypothetical protein JXR97_06860 [Planctomycetes bacterium]|nr:hypothetical protein [Planctomycetota bacterium]